MWAQSPSRLSLQRSLCLASPSLQWVAWASLPHLPAGNNAPASVLLSAKTAKSPSLVCSLFAIRPRYLIQFDCIRRQLALSSSRATPLNACSALRPRWCPQCLPYRIPDCCLPQHAKRRLSPLASQKVILTATTIHFSGLNHTACILAPPGFRLSSRSLPAGVPIGLPATL